MTNKPARAEMPSKWTPAWKATFLVFFGGLALVVGWGVHRHYTATPEERAQWAADAAADHGDQSANVRVDTTDAELKCSRRVEAEARLRTRWAVPQFPEQGWVDQDKGIYGLRGSNAEMMNSFGAWLPITYGCDYDVASKSIVRVSVREGR